MTGIDIASNIGRQISQSRHILCPACLEEFLDGEPLQQPLFTKGDDEDELFCPHCEMHLRIMALWCAAFERHPEPRKGADR